VDMDFMGCVINDAWVNARWFFLFFFLHGLCHQWRVGQCQVIFVPKPKP
jgi:hypothetical protein